VSFCDLTLSASTDLSEGRMARNHKMDVLAGNLFPRVVPEKVSGGRGKRPGLLKLAVTPT